MHQPNPQATYEPAPPESLDSLKVLLLQARAPGDPVAASERKAFAMALGLDVARVGTHDLLGGPPTLAEIRRHDALMVGGSGDFYVSKRNLPGIDAILDRMREVVETGHPTFASCFGFQLLVEALGGRVIHDPDRVEVGTHEVTLTEGGLSDPLFGDLPPRFRAQMGRKDRAESLPDGVVHLASSELCRYHALRVSRKPIWATQFHPELDRARNRSRFERYVDAYAPLMTAEERKRALDGFLESPATDRLLSRFLRVVFT
ncbi:MAG: type 1 glutamine amidotransferase [Gemmatimonadota bacterium]